MKLYIVVAVWEATKDNHAGMYHLAKEFKKRAPIPVKIIKIPTAHFHYLFWLYYIYTYIIGLYLRIVVNKSDTVWLMEYLLPALEQSRIARLLKGCTTVVGIAHLIPTLIDKYYTKNSIQRKISYLNKLYVLGSSLKSYFVDKGISPDKVITTYHYVDSDYYQPLSREFDTKMLKVICMGNMQRNYDELRHIVEACPDIQFIICAGKKNLSSYFSDFQNVTLVGYIPEEDLLHIMQSSDISLNVMNDTVGSNVITTSLAVGLPIIASNVGSIGDYVTDGKEGYLFDSIEDAIIILKQLSQNRNKVELMKFEALKKTKQIDLVSFITYFLKDNNLYNG